MNKEKKQLHLIYSIASIRSFAGGMVSIFIPIYLLKLGYEVRQVLWFFLFYSFFVLISFFLVAFLSTKFGVRKIFFMFFPALLIYLMGLYFLPILNIPLFLLAFVYALAMAFYYFGYHMFFKSFTSLEKIGDSVAKSYAIPKMLSIFSPFIGGLIAYYLGLGTLLITAFVINLFAIIPISKVNKIEVKIDFQISKIWQFFKKSKKYFWAEIFKNVDEDIEGVILPIFVYLAFKNIISIGILGTFLSIGGIIFTLFVGKSFDKYKKIKFYSIGAFLMIIVWIMRFAYQDNQVIFLISSMFAGFFGILISVPFYSKMYKMAKEKETDELIVFREIPNFIGRLSVYSLAIIFVDRLDLSFMWAAVSNVFFIFW